jgi:D-alanyl-D-alanine carboxypeptidase
MFGKCEREKREAASLTKIMTAFVVLKLMEKWKIKDSTLVEISADAAGINGTSADLLEGDTLTI